MKKHADTKDFHLFKIAQTKMVTIVVWMTYQVCSCIIKILVFQYILTLNVVYPCSYIKTAKVIKTANAY